MVGFIAGALLLIASAGEPVLKVAGEACLSSRECDQGMTCAVDRCRYVCDADADCSEGRCVSVLSVGKVCGEESGRRPPQMKRPPSQWSNQGWQKLRFGMGPGDVLAVAGEDAICDPIRGEGLETARCDGWPDRVAGAVPGMTFQYIDGELASIILIVPPPKGEGIEGLATLSYWMTNFRDAMAKKYGKPSKDSAASRPSQGMEGGTMVSVWVKPALRVTLSVSAEAAAVAYEDPARVARIEQAKRRDVQRKAAVDPSGL